jgi:hypothetical protein
LAAAVATERTEHLRRTVGTTVCIDRCNFLGFQIQFPVPGVHVLKAATPENNTTKFDVSSLLVFSSLAKNFRTRPAYRLSARFQRCSFEEIVSNEQFTHELAM